MSIGGIPKHEEGRYICYGACKYILPGDQKFPISLAGRHTRAGCMR